MLFKQKALKEVKQLVLFLSKRNLKSSDFVQILNKAKFEIIKYSIPTLGTGYVMNFCLIPLSLLLTTEGYADLHLIPSSKLFHCSVFLFNLVNSSSCSLLFSYSFG